MTDSLVDNGAGDPRKRAKATGKGRYTPKQKRSEKPFAMRTIVMLESPAHRVLSLAALRALFRLEIENCNHGGNENGKLCVTFLQFEEFGVRRHTIASALRELEALGLVNIAQRGYGGAPHLRAPNLYQLTYRPTHRVMSTPGCDPQDRGDGRRC